MGLVSPHPAAGLCDSCRHQQIVRNTRGGRFSLCRRSRHEPDVYPRYPRLPVLQCSGYERDERDERDERSATEGEAD